MAVDVHAAPTMDFSNEMDEVEEYLRTKKFPASVGPDKGKRANFRRKRKAFVIHDNCLMFVHKPSRSDSAGEQSVCRDFENIL